jgi:3-hydroxyisobutyrate dehydrogenase-like beta-hydroxyacid dehydrogenase
LEKEGIDPDVALRAMLTSSGGSNSMTRVHEYVTNNRSIDYRFVANGLIKDCNIGLSLINNRFEGDKSYEMFEVVRDIYKEMA